MSYDEILKKYLSGKSIGEGAQCAKKYDKLIEKDNGEQFINTIIEPIYQKLNLKICDPENMTKYVQNIVDLPDNCNLIKGIDSKINNLDSKINNLDSKMNNLDSKINNLEKEKNMDPIYQYWIEEYMDKKSFFMIFILFLLILLLGLCIYSTREQCPKCQVPLQSPI